MNSPWHTLYIPDTWKSVSSHKEICTETLWSLPRYLIGTNVLLKECHFQALPFQQLVIFLRSQRGIPFQMFLTPKVSVIGQMTLELQLRLWAWDARSLANFLSFLLFLSSLLFLPESLLECVIIREKLKSKHNEFRDSGIKSMDDTFLVANSSFSLLQFFSLTF